MNMINVIVNIIMMIILYVKVMIKYCNGIYHKFVHAIFIVILDNENNKNNIVKPMNTYIIIFSFLL